MKKSERCAVIQSILSDDPDTTVTRLSELLNISQVTIRKDLAEMEKNGLIERSYGHARLLDSAPILPAGSCFILPELYGDFRKKQVIGALAANFVDDDDFIFIGPGYTCLEFAKKLAVKNRLSILTTNVSAAIELSMTELPTSSETRLRVAPGDFTKRNGTYYVSGMDTIEYFKDIFFDKVFITVDGISERGFTVLDEITAQIYKAMIKPNTKVYICATHTKYGKNSPAHLGPLSMATAVISEIPIPKEYEAYFNTMGVEVVIPGTPPVV